MSTSVPSLRTSGPAPTELRNAQLLDVVRSEWTKVRSVRSTYWTVGIALVLGVGLGALISALAAHEYANNTSGVRATWDPTSVSAAGLSVAQLAIGVLGIMLITSEYSSRAISVDLTAVPRRGRYLAAKSGVTLAVSFIVSVALAFAAFFVGQALISGHAPTATLGQDHVLRALVGCGLYGALIGLLGLALGTILRSAAAAISVLVALLFVLPGIAAALPRAIEQPVEEFWPTQAGQQITAVVQGAHVLSSWAGFGVLAAFVSVMWSIAYIALTRRDA
jgi:ABC-2 type transport system permease protein